MLSSLVVLDQNPDRRDLEMGRAGLIKKLSYGFRKRDVRDVLVKRLGDDLLEVTPKQDLEAGEYILVLGGVASPLSMPGNRGRSRSVIIPGGGPVGVSAGTEGTTGYDFGIIGANKVASN